MRKAAAVLLSALLATTLAQATPSTLIWIPSTDIQAGGTWHLGVDNYFTLTAGSSAPTAIGLTRGLGSGRLEVGFDYLGGQDDPLSLNAKYLLLAEDGGRPAVAVGGYNFGLERGVTDMNVLYLVAAKSLGPVRVTAGYARGKAETLGPDADMLLCGVDGYLSADRKWWGAVDYQSGASVLGALSLGVSYSFAENVSVILGYDIYGDAATENTLTTQVDINF